jgi:hypothetical protein
LLFDKYLSAIGLSSVRAILPAIDNRSNVVG